MSEDRKNDASFRLNMDFSEALERFARVDPRFVPKNKSGKKKRTQQKSNNKPTMKDKGEASPNSSIKDN